MTTHDIVIFARPTPPEPELVPDTAKVVLHVEGLPLHGPGTLLVRIHVLRSVYGDPFHVDAPINFRFTDPSLEQSKAAARDAEIAAARAVLAKHGVA